MRVYLYLLAGVTSALIGWNISQIILVDLGILRTQQLEEIVLFPCIAISLAIGMVLNEIFISSPTRLKLCLRKCLIPILIALGLGSLLGLSAGGISQLLYIPQIGISPVFVRMLSWLIVGIAVGLSEGLTWRWQSVEAGDTKRFWQRFFTSLCGGIVASLIAAVIVEYIHSLNDIPIWFKKIEAPLGFSLLGLLLGLTFSITTSPSYIAALRAGTGFEYTGESYDNFTDSLDEKFYPSIDQSSLQFVSDGDTDFIEEGLSIKLPGKGKILIGSEKNADAHIRLPGIAFTAAEIDLKGRQTKFKPNQQTFRSIAINGDLLGSKRDINLKHNDIVTFYTQEEGNINGQKIYRFVYYNRFLDPQA